MAGYIIHLAVAEEYLRKHKNDIENYGEFITGVVAPDDVKDKSLTHYGEKSSKVNLEKFIEENDIKADYQKGYFLHLITDYLFYNKYLECFSKDIYNDYDITNKCLIEEYKLKIPEKIENRIFFQNGETKILSINLARKVINEVSEYSLNEVYNQIKEENSYWLTIRDLKKV